MNLIDAIRHNLKLTCDQSQHLNRLGRAFTTTGNTVLANELFSIAQDAQNHAQLLYDAYCSDLAERGEPSKIMTP